MSYNKQITENIQKLLQSRKSFMASRTQPSSQINDATCDAFDVDSRHSPSRIKLSPTQLESDATIPSSPRLSKLSVRSSIEEVDCKEYQRHGSIQNTQVGLRSYIYLNGLFLTP